MLFILVLINSLKNCINDILGCTSYFCHLTDWKSSINVQSNAASIFKSKVKRQQLHRGFEHESKISFSLIIIIKLNSFWELNYHDQKIQRIPTYDIQKYWTAVSTVLGLINRNLIQQLIITAKDMLSIIDTEISWVQILDKAIWISLCAYTFKKGINPSIFLQLWVNSRADWVL